MQIPTRGRIVEYTLTEQDAEAINRRRTTPANIARRIQEGGWPIGIPVVAGETVSAIVTRTNLDDHANPLAVTSVNLKCFLDGADDYWVTGVIESLGQRLPGHWNWPPRA